MRCSDRKPLQAGREQGGFKLRQRALHVFREAQRVRDFKAVCDVSGCLRTLPLAHSWAWLHCRLQI